MILLPRRFPIARSVRRFNAAKIEAIIPLLLEHDEPISVLDSTDQLIGVVSRESVARILQADQK